MLVLCLDYTPRLGPNREEVFTCSLKEGDQTAVTIFSQEHDEFYVNDWLKDSAYMALTDPELEFLPDKPTLLQAWVAYYDLEKPGCDSAGYLPEPWESQYLILESWSQNHMLGNAFSGTYAPQVCIGRYKGQLTASWEEIEIRNQKLNGTGVHRSYEIAPEIILKNIGTNNVIRFKA